VSAFADWLLGRSPQIIHGRRVHKCWDRVNRNSLAQWWRKRHLRWYIRIVK
jgi:hypothetical protein